MPRGLSKATMTLIILPITVLFTHKMWWAGLSNQDEQICLERQLMLFMSLVFQGVEITTQSYKFGFHQLWNLNIQNTALHELKAREAGLGPRDCWFNFLHWHENVRADWVNSTFSSLCIHGRSDLEQGTEPLTAPGHSRSVSTSHVCTHSHLGWVKMLRNT